MALKLQCREHGAHSRSLYCQACKLIDQIRKGVSPRPQNFKLTEERVRYFEKDNFGLNPLGNIVIWVGLWVACTGYFSDSRKISAAFVYGFLVSLPLTVLIFLLIEKILRWFHSHTTKRQPDYPGYIYYRRALAAYESHITEVRRQKNLMEDAEHRRREKEKRRKLEFWNSLDGLAFERELGEFFVSKGYDVALTPPSGDQGADLIMKITGKTIVVQCKAQKKLVGPAVVRELFGTMHHFRADEAWLVTTSGFHSGAKSFAREKPMKLLLISDLLEEDKVQSR